MDNIILMWLWKWAVNIFSKIITAGYMLGRVTGFCAGTLHWHQNECDGVSNHQRLDCLLNCLFRRRSKKKSKLRITGLCEGNSPVTSEFPSQRASNVENVSIWRRHHESGKSQGKSRNLFLPTLATLTRAIIILPQWAVVILPQWQCSKPEGYEVSITIMIWTSYGLTLNHSATVTIKSLI